MRTRLLSAARAQNRSRPFPSSHAGLLATAFLALAAFCLAPEISLAAGPGFTDANWVSLPGANAAIYSVVLDTNSNLFVAGAFTNVGGVGANYVAEWNGVTWRSLGSGMNGMASSLAFDTSGNLYVGGYFTTAGGVSADYVARWDGTNWYNLGSGMSGTTYPFIQGVYALVCDGVGNLYASGSFTNAGGASANHIAKWNGSTWTALGSGMNGEVFALAFDTNGNLYAGGQFSSAGGVGATNIAEWNGSVWSALGPGWPANVSVFAFCFDDSGNLYVGGNIVYPNSGFGLLTKWNGTNWSPLAANGFVYSLAYRAPNLYMGGSFASVGGVIPRGIADWNGHAWSVLGSGIGGVYATSPAAESMVVDSAGNLYVGGYFLTAGTNTANYIAKALLVGPTPDQMTLVQPAPSTNIITYLGTPGSAYALDAATALTPPINWIPQATNTAPTNNAATAGYLTFTNLSAAPQAFYRVRSVP
jgi:hypothetical protein